MQASCVAWFRYFYKDYRFRLFAVPNGEFRSQSTGAKLKEEGVLAGVSDLILLVPRKGYGALCIEMKTASNNSRQSLVQKMWQEDVERNNDYKYVICRSVNGFIEVVDEYMKY